MFGGKGGDTGKPELLAGHRHGVADGEDAGVKHADDITGVGFVDDLALRSHQLLGLTQAHFLVALDVVDFGFPLVLAGTDAQERKTVPVGLVHIGLNLEDKSGEIGGEGVDFAAVGHTGQGRRRHLQEVFQERLHAEVGQGGAEEHGAQGAVSDGVHVKFPTGGQQLHVIDELLMAFRADVVGHCRVIEVNLQLFGPVLAGYAGEKGNVPLVAVVDALELLAGADGPVDGIRLNAQFLLQLFQQVEGVLAVPVHLVDEGKNGDMAHGADLEQLPRLGLDALGTVDDHDRRVGGHQGTVGVLGKVLVAGGVQNVDAEAVVLELQYRRGDGDTALLFNLHPVGDGGTGVFLALDGAGLGDGASVQEEFFRQGGFTGVGVRDDGKGPAAADFFAQSRHAIPSTNRKIELSQQIDLFYHNYTTVTRSFFTSDTVRRISVAIWCRI